MPDPEKSEGNPWLWLSRNLIEVLHAETLYRFGGAEGLRSEDLLESALSVPRQLAQYKQPTVHELASAYAHALIRNHPFVDGNKRIGLLAARAFLFQNGYRLNPDEAQTVTVIRRVAAGDIDQAELARWLEENSRTVE